ncbi:CocE/NonD family hydrolase [Flavisphingomonas formosensis]|uniref:CocE/NonD family hydrolase n=1 Tax=Flavisphingomonas formosensis TaxID=861534 RepID=UPI0012F75F63|nr:CocE/NonD family hydrolase [Sphingomonas formosensis]
MTTKDSGEWRIIVEHDVPMRTRDGVTLYSDVYRPDAEGTFPVMIIRTPYDKGMQVYADGKTMSRHLIHSRYFPKHGYVVVVQDTRGRWQSGGDFYPYVWDAEDGFDTVEWAASQSWSNGKVAIVGKSYMGLVQYLAAIEKPPHLVAGAPMSAPISYFENCVYRRGVFELGWQLSYIIGLARDIAIRMGGAEGERRLHYLNQFLENPAIRFGKLKMPEFLHLPLRDWIDRLAEDAPYVRDLIDNWKDGAYWHGMDARPRARDVTIPMLHVGSWFDPFLVDTTEMFNRIRAEAPEEVARNQKMLIGPWTHIFGSRIAGQVDFGPEAELDIDELELRWYDHWMKGIDTGLMDEAPVKIFVMGANRWRHEQEWPIARTRYTPLYLGSGGRANSRDGDGRLSFDRPGVQPPDSYIYDPADPVPTCGGTTLLSFGGDAGSCDQAIVEVRQDVLVYTSDTLEKPIEVVGPILMRLFAATSAPDTDFMVKLVDVRPDGSAFNVADGVIRARFREALDQPTMVEPGAIVEYEIDMWSTAHLFQAGHRIRVDVTSSDFPRYDRNPNTGHDFGTDAAEDLARARQTIFHDARFASHIVLPVISD